MFDKIFGKKDPEELNENFFRIINKDWMLVTAGSPGHFNTMTASWGSIGILWNMPIAICFIRPHRYTFGFAEKHDYFTLSFFEKKYRKALNFCGTHSGRDTDKMTQTGLTPVMAPKGSLTFEQARLVLECKKIYADFIREEQFVVRDIISQHYPGKDFHKFFIGEITDCYVGK